LPLWSVATQKVSVGHDIDAMACVASMMTGVVHVVPLYVLTPPVRSPATQKVALAHDTVVTPPLPLTRVVPSLHFNLAACDVSVVAPAEPAVTVTVPRTDTHIKVANKERQPATLNDE
jgi:hypothetical protein